MHRWSRSILVSLCRSIVMSRVGIVVIRHQGLRSRSYHDGVVGGELPVQGRAAYGRGAQVVAAAEVSVVVGRRQQVVVWRRSVHTTRILHYISSRVSLDEIKLISGHLSEENGPLVCYWELPPLTIMEPTPIVYNKYTLIFIVLKILFTKSI